LAIDRIRNRNVSIKECHYVSRKIQLNCEVKEAAQRIRIPISDVREPRKGADALSDRIKKTLIVYK